MSIGLMPYIPHQLIVRCVVNVMQCHAEFYDAKAGSKMSIQASSHSAGGSQIHMVPVAEVLYFEAADKYVRVLTAAREYLIRTPLKELTSQLDPQVFWQIHRSTLVRANAITTVTRDEVGKLHLELAGRAEKLPVSRLYAHLFKAM